MRVTESIGVVAFVDAGAAFSSRFPDFDDELRVGAGPGIRYFSPIGPFRLEFGGQEGEQSQRRGVGAWTLGFL